MKESVLIDLKLKEKDAKFFCKAYQLFLEKTK